MRDQSRGADKSEATRRMKQVQTQLLQHDGRAATFRDQELRRALRPKSPRVVAPPRTPICYVRILFRSTKRRREPSARARVAARARVRAHFSDAGVEVLHAGGVSVRAGRVVPVHEEVAVVAGEEVVVHVVVARGAEPDPSEVLQPAAPWSPLRRLSPSIASLVNEMSIASSLLGSKE